MYVRTHIGDWQISFFFVCSFSIPSIASFSANARETNTLVHIFVALHLPIWRQVNRAPVPAFISYAFYVALHTIYSFGMWLFSAPFISHGIFCAAHRCNCEMKKRKTTDWILTRGCHTRYTICIPHTVYEYHWLPMQTRSEMFWSVCPNSCTQLTQTGQKYPFLGKTFSPNHCMAVRRDYTIWFKGEESDFPCFLLSNFQFFISIFLRIDSVIFHFSIFANHWAHAGCTVGQSSESDRT